MRRLWALLLAGSLLLPAPASGQTANDIIRERRRVPQLSAQAEPLRQILEAEVREILQAGHLMPFRIQYGEGESDTPDLNHAHAFHEPWAMMFALARAYPYLPADVQAEVISYVRSENDLHAPWSETSLGPSGAYRQGDLPGVPEDGLPAQYKRRGSMLYALWLYGDNTGDWSDIQPQWSSLKSIYSQIRSAYRTYELIGGAIAMSRMAHLFGDETASAQYENDALSFMTEGLNFETYRRNAHLDYAGRDDWYRGDTGIAYPLFWLSPEVARYFKTYATLLSAIEDYAEQAAWNWPLWWMAQAPIGDAGYFGEGNAAGPETRMMLFNYYAWVKGTSPTELRLYVDVPDALVGDLFYLQNLVTAVEAFGQECWEDLWTGESTCGQPPVSPTFVDVPFTHPYHDYIEALYQAGYIAGCSASPLMYCPETTMNRAESAVFVERGIHAAAYSPPVPATQVFADMPLDSWAAGWVNGLWEDRYTAGCGTSPLVYCPWQGHTRAEGAVFYMRMLMGADYSPPDPSQSIFADVPLEAWYARWVHAAHEAALIEPCQTVPQLRYCPEDPLTRAVAAYMMTQAKKNLPLP